MNKGVEIFFSYAHASEDEELVEELVKHLSVWKRQKLISPWHDRDICAGEEWQSTIATHLDTAQIILLLISPDFISSDYCNSIEVKRAMQRHTSGDARVIPIILRPVAWQDAPFGKLQALPKGSKPITLWENRDQAFLNVTQSIQSIVKDFYLVQEIDQEIEKEEKIREKGLRRNNFPTWRTTPSHFWKPLSLKLPNESQMGISEQKYQDATTMLMINRQYTPERKYILVSCAEEDEDVARDIVYFMKDYWGINSDLKWVYQTSLKSDRRMQNVVHRAFTILLIASPSSKVSGLVQDAIQTGRDYECPICPVWIADTKWEDWLPGSPAHGELVDYRKETDRWKKSHLIGQVANALSQTIADRSSNHIRLRANDYHWHLPGYITIVVNHSSQIKIALKYDLYPSFRLLLDDIYLKYLTDRYDPFTYGTKWALVNTANHSFDQVVPLALPWIRLLPSHKVDESAMLKSIENHPARCGLKANTQWQVDQLPLSSIFGIATNNNHINELCSDSWHSPKEMHRLVKRLRQAQLTQPGEKLETSRISRGQIRSVSPEEVNPEAYQFLMLFTSPALDGTDYNRLAFIIG